MRVGPGLPVAGNPDQDDARVAFGQHVVAKVPLFQCAGTKVLHHDVGFLDEIKEQLAATWPAQVECDPLLLRACTVQKTWCPSSSAWPQVRNGSGAPGGSTLMTSAPMSPSSRPANGPAIKVPSSSTRMPSSAPSFGAREVVADQPVGDDVDGLTKFVALVRARVIVCGAGDFVHLLVGVPDRLE